MQEIAPHIYIETSYSGVTLGAIVWTHGLILIDSPFKIEDTRSWRASLLNMGSSTDRLLVNLDAHVDRTLGVRSMECTVIGHEEIAEAYRSRPLTFKAQFGESGAEWEMYEGIGSTRWASPDITFTKNLILHWDNSPIIMEQWSGSAIGSICIHLPQEKVLFLGDIVTPNQPPFLSDANLPEWIKRLKELSQPQYNDYLLVSGRGGMITQADVKNQLQFLEKTNELLNNIAAQKLGAEATDHIVTGLLADFQASNERKSQYQRRLQYGLKHYYLNHFMETSQGSINE